MAGAAAEEQLTGKKKSGTSWGGTDYINAVKIAKQWAKQTGKILDESYLIDISIKADGITGCLFSAAFLDEFAAHVRQLMTRPHIWKCIEAVARELQNKTVLSQEETTDIISMTWEAMDRDEQEIVMEKQKSDSNERPWAEWRPE